MIKRIIVPSAKKVIVFFCNKTSIIEEELRKEINTLNSGVVVWKISSYKNDPTVLTLFPVH